MNCVKYEDRTQFRSITYIQNIVGTILLLSARTWLSQFFVYFLLWLLYLHPPFNCLWYHRISSIFLLPMCFLPHSFDRLSFDTSSCHSNHFRVTWCRADSVLLVFSLILPLWAAFPPFFKYILQQRVANFSIEPNIYVPLLITQQLLSGL